MKTTLHKSFRCFLWSVMAFWLVSCGVDRWAEYAEQTELDTWMYDVMQEHYLWHGSLPAYKNVNPFLSPSAFLSSVKVTGDSYSYVDTVLLAPLPAYGFSYTLVRSLDVDTAFNALITDIVPGSPAARAGLNRGDWIMKVDTAYISQKYAQSLLEGTAARTLTVGSYQKVEPVEETSSEVEVYRVVATGEVALGAAESVEDSPIRYSSILTLTNGNKVGYLVYNHFTAGTSSDADYYNAALRTLVAEFADAGVGAVILDLRNNKGGSLDCMQLLATLLVPSSYLDQPMAILEYSDKQAAKNKTLTFDSSLAGSGSRLNLQTLVALTGTDTAGAPEMLLNSLKGKVSELITIGGATKGQNVATERFVHETRLWAINPVVCTVYNSENETFSSLSPTHSVNFATDYLHYLPYGNTSESLLSVALRVLNGTI